MMTDNEREGFQALMDSLCERFGRQLFSPRTIALSFAVINDEIPDVTLSELTRAAARLMRTTKYFPSDFELIEAVQDDRDRNTAPYHRQFALPPRVEPDEKTRAAMEDAKRRIRACAARVGRPMPTVANPWEDAPWTDARTPEQVAASRAEIAEQLASMTRRND